jgi:DNA-binding NarL/FixJ family response regulator
MHEDQDFLQAALKTGATGYVIKRCIGSELLEAVEIVLSGKTFISASLRTEEDKARLRVSA